MFDFSSGELAALRADFPQGKPVRRGSPQRVGQGAGILPQDHDAAQRGGLLSVDALCRRLLSRYRGICWPRRSCRAARTPPMRGGRRFSSLSGWRQTMRRPAPAVFPGFCAGWTARSRRGQTGGRGAGMPEGYVKIMSIHRSKGLGIPGLHPRGHDAAVLTKGSVHRPVLRHTQLGIGLCLREEGGARYPTGPQRAIRRHCCGSSCPRRCGCSMWR